MIVILRVHPITYHTLRKEYGTIRLQLTHSHLLIPLLAFKPQARPPQLTREIILEGPHQLLCAIHPDAGATLYEYHMDKLIQHMDFAVAQGGYAEVAMKQFYTYIGMEIDDLDYHTAYKRWQRWKMKKKLPKIETKSQIGVLRKSQSRLTPLESCLSTASEIISRDPDRYIAPDGTPLHTLILKLVIYVMADVYGWKQVDIAEHLSRTTKNVNYHLSTFRRMAQRVSVL